MQNGAFFEVYGLKNKNNHIYGCKLEDFSRICDLNIVDKKVPGGDMTINEDQVVNAGFKTHLIEKYIKKLQDNGYTIIVYEEEGEDPVKKTKIRNKTGIYSPGTSFDQDTELITNNICCLWIENNKSILKHNVTNQIYIGVGLIDIYTGNTYINEYNDEYIKNPCTFDDLERFISIYNPSETIIVSNLPTNDINDIINFINLKSKSLHIVSTFHTDILPNVNIIRANNCEKQIYQTELLSKFYKIYDINSFMSIFYDNVYATQAFCFLLDFVYQHNPYLIQNISEPLLENTSHKLILANHSLKQLNIIDDDNYKGKYSSVSKMLNECITSMGKRKFTNNFLNPVTDKHYLQTEFNIIDKLLEETNEYNTIKTLLVQIKDITKIMRQIILQKGTPKLLDHLYSSIITSKIVYNSVIRNEHLTEYLKHKLPDFVSLINKADDIIHYFDKVFIIDDCKDIDNINKIEKSFIQNGVDNVLDTNIQTLMDSQDQLEACRFYFSSLISNYETSLKPKKNIKKKTE
jgi:DNA mismatch repair protein MutS